jgi:hypothetical protein
MVYIVDKARSLRGRKEVKDYKEGYTTFHPSDLSNEMIDDFKIILMSTVQLLRRIVMRLNNFNL